MTQQTIAIDGLPEGWKAVAYRKPKEGEYCWSASDRIYQATISVAPCFILEKIQTRRIVLEETEEGNHTVAFHNDDGRWTYWKEVKE